MSSTPNAPDARPARLWSPIFLLLLVVNLCSSMAGQMVIPIVAKYALHLGASLEMASTIASLMSLAGLVLCPFAGLASDRLNRKWLLVISTAVNGVSVLLHAATASVGMLVGIRLVTGISFSFLSVSVMAYTSTFLPRERLGEGLGYITLANIVSQALGPGLGLELLDRFGYGSTFLVAGLFALTCSVVVLLIPYHEAPRATARRRLRASDLFAPQLLLFTLLIALLSAANGLASTYLAIIADERQIANVSLFFTAYSVCMIFLRPFAGKLLDRRGIYVILVPAYLLAAAGLVLVGVGNALWMIVLAGVLKAFGQGAGTPSIQAHCVKAMSRDRAGVATSTCQIGQHVGNALAPILGARVVSATGSYATLFCGYAGILLVVGWVLLLLQRLWDRKRAAQAAEAE